MLKRSKLLAPSLEGSIQRPRLLERLAEPAPLRMLVAPAGFGKSTLAAQWLAQGYRQPSWLSLDKSDRDGPLLWANLIACLRQWRPGLGSLAGSLLRQSPLPLDGIVESLLDDLTVWRMDAPDSGPHWVIDDLHWLDGGTNLAGLLAITAALAGWGRVLFTSRTATTLARLDHVPAAAVDTIDQHQLVFDTAEIQALASIRGLDLPDDLCQTLRDRTGGWVTPIQLILQQMRNDGASTHWNDAWLDGQRIALAPLIAAHQAAQSPASITLLTLLAPVPQFDRSLVTALAEQMPHLEEGVAAIWTDAFVIRLQQAGWWKIHDLYRAQLLEDFAALASERQQQALLIMADWLCSHGAHAQALALQADYAQPPALHRFLLQRYPHWLRLGLHDLLEQATAMLDETVVRSDPRLCAMYLWARADRLALEQCRQWLNDALGQARSQPGNPGLMSELYSLLSYCEQVKGDPAAAQQHAASAVTWAGQADAPRRSRPLLTLGLLTYMHGHMGDASDALARTLVCAQQEHHYYHVILTLGYWMEALRLAGQLDEALAICDRTRQWLQSCPEAEPADRWLDLPALDILIARDHLDEAGRRLQPLLQFAGHAPPSLRTALIYFCAARVHYYQGDLHTSLEYLSRVEAAQARLNLDWNWGWAPVDAWRRRIALAQQRTRTLQDWYDQHPIDPAAPMPFAGVEERLLDAAILARLGRLEQAEILASQIEQAAARQGRAFHRLQALIVLGNVGWCRVPGDINHSAREATALVTAMGAPVILRSEALWLEPERRPAAPESTLSKRELAVLALLAQGKSNHDIAAALHISTHTAKTHMKNILRKLDARNRTEAVAAARAFGLI